jgi:predicted membrane channel-forming protein YqfA (hemolysin III family)
LVRALVLMVGRMARNLLHGIRILAITKAEVKVQNKAAVTHLKLTWTKKHHNNVKCYVVNLISFCLASSTWHWCASSLVQTTGWFSERTQLRKEVTHRPPTWFRVPAW